MVQYDLARLCDWPWFDQPRTFEPFGHITAAAGFPFHWHHHLSGSWALAASGPLIVLFAILCMLSVIFPIPLHYPGFRRRSKVPRRIPEDCREIPLELVISEQ